MASEKFERLFTKKSECIQVNGNFATAVKVDFSSTTPDSVRDKAVERHPNVFPSLTPDNASTVLVFHTESGDHTLAAIRKNPDVDPSFPEQINGSTGGYLPADRCSGSFLDALLTTLSQKMLLDNAPLIEQLESDGNDVGLAALNRLARLRDAVATPEGWGSTIAVHAYQGDWKMCVLTAVKHIGCSDADLQQIQQDLALLMPIERQRIIDATPAGARPNLRTISNFQLFKLDPLVTNAQQSYCMEENSKAEKAQLEHPDQVIVTFNDFALERLAAYKGFKSPVNGFAKLELEVAGYAQTVTSFQ